MEIGEALQKARNEAGLTQQELADGAGVTRVYISMLERGLKSPTLDVFGRLCATLGIAPSKLLARIEKAGRQ